jgi:hypothetical protein
VATINALIRSVRARGCPVIGLARLWFCLRKPNLGEVLGTTS